MRREYLSRVMKKTFWIWTFILPFLITGSISGLVWMLKTNDSKIYIQVIDETNGIKQLENTETMFFEYGSNNLEEAKNNLTHAPYDAVLHLSSDLVDADAAKIYLNNSLGVFALESIKNQLGTVLEEYKLSKSKIDPQVYYSIWSKIKLEEISFSDEGEEVSKAVTDAFLGIAMALIMFLFVVLYSVQVMRGIIEEKASRIIEVIISSVKPFQFMSGKILGIALVGITQFALWTILMFIASAIFQTATINPAEMQEAQKVVAELNLAEFNLDFGHLAFLGCMFIFYFLGGYLLYSALFAAVGSMIETEAESQQFMLPVMLPLIISYLTMMSGFENPNSPIIKWMSIFPLTSPIVMMTRITQDVPIIELISSICLLVLAVLGTTWLAAKIFRVGILMYGKKVTYGEVWKWIKYR